MILVDHVRLKKKIQKQQIFVIFWKWHIYLYNDRISIFPLVQNFPGIRIFFVSFKDLIQGSQ